MRRIQFLCLAIAFRGLFAAAGDTGVPPRLNSSEYPVHQDIKTGTIAAALVASDQVKKIFSNDFNKRYVVIEVAFYPRNGGATNIDSFDFALKLGASELIHPARAEEAAKIWHEKDGPLSGHRINVTSGAGVVYASGGGTHGWGTYAGVGVEAGGSGQQTAPPLPPSSPADPHTLESTIREKALPEGQTSGAVAGYLYFRVAAKSFKGISISLEYLKDGAVLSLPLPSR